MAKNHSKVELVATDKKKINEYQMKTLSHPNLPILYNHKINNQTPMKFPMIAGGFKTAFCLKQIPNHLKFKAIVDGLYNYLEIKYLETMTRNKQNYLEIKQSSFIAVYSSI